MRKAGAAGNESGRPRRVDPPGTDTADADPALKRTAKPQWAAIGGIRERRIPIAAVTQVRPNTRRMRPSQ
jgi:hypothetical protein